MLHVMTAYSAPNNLVTCIILICLYFSHYTSPLAYCCFCRVIGPEMPSAELLAAAAKLTEAEAELR